jgi:GNAT superfamily N-acetyltransferase
MEVQIRDAIESDAEAISPLLCQLMHEPSTAEQIRARLRRLGETGVDRILVAVADGQVAGLAGLHVAWMVHADRPTARLMTLVVDERCRGRGIGRRLVQASCEQARTWGCDRLELTSRLTRTGAHSFYESVGFEHTSKRFSMPLQ